ncbi:MAG: major facilitator superfamily domain-containing protein 7 [Asgard group archaeon]|nr:major facilitator superfamily domain-containing protein 7 [Asgard group archaeon]
MELESSSNIDNEIIDPEQPKYKSYKYRWIVLILFMFAGAITQIIWVTYGTIVDETAGFFSVSEIEILLLALIFMVVYIPVNFLACWVIDKLGLKWGTGIGVILTGVFGFLRVFAVIMATPNYPMLLTFQIMTAIGQPFVLNSFTKLAAAWFPESEKTLASGLGTMSMLIGVLIAFLLPPMLVTRIGIDLTMSWITWSFGIAALVCMVLYLIFVRNKPPTPPNAYADETKTLALKGTRSMFKKRDFNLLFVIFLFGFGSFNAISAVIDVIFDYPIEDPIPGHIGALIIGGGILGAVVISALSDYLRKRKIFIIISMAAGIVLLPIFFFVDVTIVRYIISFFAGFFLISLLPVGLTYAAEITHPLPEETSNGLMMWVGQIGGIVLLGCIMLAESSSYMFINFIVMIVLFVASTVLAFLMKDLSAYEVKS